MTTRRPLAACGAALMPEPGDEREYQRQWHLARCLCGGDQDRDLPGALAVRMLVRLIRVCGFYGGYGFITKLGLR